MIALMFFVGSTAAAGLLILGLYILYCCGYLRLTPQTPFETVIQKCLTCGRRYVAVTEIVYPSLNCGLCRGKGVPRCAECGCVKSNLETTCRACTTKEKN
jgi:hypothetical protein